MPPIPILAEAGWRLRLHSPGLAPDEVADALEPLRRLLAGLSPAIGFVPLHRQRGGLSCALHRWTAAGLEREAMLIPHGGGPSHHCSALSGGLGAEAMFLLLAREAAAWRRHVLLAERPDADAYLAAA